MTDGFIVTNGDGQAATMGDGEVHVLNTAKEVAEAVELLSTLDYPPVVYALVPIPQALVSHYIDTRAHQGMTRAGFLHDLALRFLGILEWPDGSGKSSEESAQSLTDLSEPTDTWKE